MTCSEFQALLSRYPDDIPDEATKDAFLQHAATCASCAGQLAAHGAMLSALGALDDDVEAPQVFADGWREKVRAEPVTAGGKRVVRWQGIVAVAAMVCLVFAGTGLMRAGLLFPNATHSASPSASETREVLSRTAVMGKMEAADALPAAVPDASFLSSAMYDEADDGYAMDAEAEYATDSAPSEEKILYTGSMNLESMQYEKDLASIDALLQSYHAVVEHRSENGLPYHEDAGNGRYVWLQARVPQESLQAFMNEAKGIGLVTSSTLDAEDVTASYRDNAGRLAMYEAQRERLLALMETASRMQDIIELESRLSEVQYQIEALTGRQNNLDSRVAYAQVSISLTEQPPQAEPVEEAGIWQRVRVAISGSLIAAGDFLADAVVFVSASLPFLLLVLAACVICYGLYWLVKRRKNG